MKIRNAMQFALSLSLGCLGAKGFAHEEHNHQKEEGDAHDHSEGAFDFDEFELVFKGTQAFGEACYLGIVSIDTKEDGSFKSAVVETSFNHGDSGPGELTVAQDAKDPNMLSFKEYDANGKLVRGIAIGLADTLTGIDIESASIYAVSWAHVGHVDSGVCEDLELVYEASHDSHQEENQANHDHQNHDHN